MSLKMGSQKVTGHQCQAQTLYPKPPRQLLCALTCFETGAMWGDFSPNPLQPDPVQAMQPEGTRSCTSLQGVIPFVHLLFVGKQREQDQGFPFLEALHHRDRDIADMKCNVPAHLPRQEQLGTFLSTKKSVRKVPGLGKESRRKLSGLRASC